MRFYLVIVYGDIEPVIKGPYKTKAARDCAAFRHRQKTSDDGVYKLNVTSEGAPQIGAYSGGFMDGSFGNPCSKDFYKKLGIGKR